MSGWLLVVGTELAAGANTVIADLGLTASAIVAGVEDDISNEEDP